MDGELSYKGFGIQHGRNFTRGRPSVAFLYTNSGPPNTNGFYNGEKRWRVRQFQLRLHTAVRAG